MSAHNDEIIETMLRSLAPGCPVVTADGDEIGKLGEVAENAIKVNAPLRMDFWVKADHVQSCHSGTIELTFPKKDLGAYRMDDVSVHAEAAKGQKGDHIISDAEQLRTRLRMEQELAQQRRALPHLHPRGEDGPPDTFGTLGEPVEEELERYDVPGFERGDTSGFERPGVANGYPSGTRSRHWVAALALLLIMGVGFWLIYRRER